VNIRVTDWFIRDINLSNEQTVFLANEQQLLDVERFCTNPERFLVLSVDAMSLSTILCLERTETLCWKRVRV
jgi:hypothetical protein